MSYTVIARYFGGPWEDIDTFDDINEALICKGEVERDAMGRLVETSIINDEVIIE